MKILITGGTGFLGKELIKRLYPNHDLTVVARNEGKLIELKEQYKHIEIFTGDIANQYVADALCQGKDKLYHLAAFKHVGQAETQPIQCTQSNILGTMSMLYAFEGTQFTAISTDKAAQVSGVYGATKYLMEKLIHEYSKTYEETNYTVVRYGNVLYSTGSVLVKWKNILKKGGQIVVTDLDATRFFFTVEQAVDLIFEAEEKATSPEPYCTYMKSIRIGDLLEAMQNKYGKASNIEIIGLQKGENMHEKILDHGPYSNEVQQYSVEEIINLI